jgi:hypothetical protein
MGGFTAATFGVAQRNLFTATLANQLHVSSETVSVTGVADVAASSHRLLQSGGSMSSVSVSFQVTSAEAGGALLASVTALNADASAFVAALQNAGLSITSLAVAMPTITTVSMPQPPPAAPQNFTSETVAEVYVQDVLANISSAANASEAVGMVSAAAATLNAPNSALNANASAAAEVRAELLSAIGSSAASASTPAALESVADAVQSLVSNASQINAAGASAALDLLLAVSSAGTVRGLVVSNGTGYAVAASLSSIVSAALAPNSAINASVLAQVFDVVNSLASSQLSSLATGAPPLEISSPAIQMRVQVDALGAGSRLFSQSLTAPGSASAFAPLPASLFDGAGAAASGGVRTQFASLTFDPYYEAVAVDADAPSSTGITRLAFTSVDGTPIEIANLAMPIQFTMPSLALADGRKAQCQFWDTAAAAYSTRGCVGIPDPRPANHTLVWAPGFTAASDGAMAAAWNISGALIDPARCSTRVLDCSMPGQNASIFPNPSNPFALPAVRCDTAVSTAPMLVISGSRCLLIQPDNVQACYWNNTAQAFNGAGCVASGAPINCACRHVRSFVRVDVRSMHAWRRVPARPTLQAPSPRSDAALAAHGAPARS